MRIDTLKISRLRNDEHFQCMTEFRDLVMTTTPAALKIAPQFNTWLTLYEQEDMALKKIVKSALTKDIQDADKTRDLIFRSLVDANKSALNHFSSTVRNAATRLKIVFDTYGNVAIKPLNEETSALYNLLADLKSSRYAALVTAAGLDAWILPLEESNNAVGELIKERYEESDANTDLVLKEVRSQIDALYYTLVEIINVRAITETAPLFDAFIHHWNTIVTKFDTILVQRYGRIAATKARKTALEEENVDDEGESNEKMAKAEIVSTIRDAKPDKK